MIHIHKEATGSVAACVCSSAKVAERETGRSSSTTPPPTADGGWLAKPTPNITARLMGRGATDSNAERREGFALDSRNRLTCCTGSAIEVLMPFYVLSNCELMLLFGGWGAKSL